MAAVTLRIDKTTVQKHIRKVEEAMLQKYGLLRFLQKKSRITFNNGSYEQTWPVYYKRNELVQMGDAEVMQYSRINRHERAAIGYRSQSMNESISKMEKLQNRGKEAIVKLVDGKIDRMLDDAYCDLDKQIYLDGDESGREQRLQGFRTVLGKVATTSDQYPAPDSGNTYAGLNTALGHYGGSIAGSATYPDGVIDPEYYFWTPFQTKYDHSSFGGTTWEDNCVEAVRATLDYVQGSRGDDARPDMLWMPTKQFTQFKQRHDVKERVEVSKNSDLTSFGFKAINFEGSDLVMDFHVPAGDVYGFRAEDVELMSMQGDLLEAAEDKSLEDRTDRFSVDFFGNLKFKQVRSLVLLSNTFS